MKEMVNTLAEALKKRLKDFVNVVFYHITDKSEKEYRLREGLRKQLVELGAKQIRDGYYLYRTTESPNEVLDLLREYVKHDCDYISIVDLNSGLFVEHPETILTKIR